MISRRGVQRAGLAGRGRSAPAPHPLRSRVTPAPLPQARRAALRPPAGRDPAEVPSALCCVTWLGCLQNLELSRQHHKTRGSKQLNWVILYTFWWVKKRFPQCAIKARSRERIWRF